MAKYPIHFSVGVPLPAVTATVLGRKLTGMLGLSVEFSWRIVDERVTIFELPCEVRCGTDRFDRLKSFVDGFKFGYCGS